MMLHTSQKMKYMIDLNNRILSIFNRSLSNKPFYYQELFEHANPVKIPFKKLTSTSISKIFVFQLISFIHSNSNNLLTIIIWRRSCLNIWGKRSENIKSRTKGFRDACRTGNGRYRAFTSASSSPSTKFKDHN